MKFVKIIIVFLIGITLSYLATNFFNDGSFGIFTAICFSGSLIYSKLSNNNSKNK